MNSLENLALVHHMRANFDAAEPLLLRMLEAQEKILGLKHVGLVKTLDLLGTQCLKQGRCSASESGLGVPVPVQRSRVSVSANTSTQ